MYKVEVKLVNTCNYGVAHYRDRYYYVGIRKDTGAANFRWPPNQKKASLNDILGKCIKSPTSEDAPHVDTGTGRGRTAYRNLHKVIRKLISEEKDPFEQPCCVGIDSSEKKRRARPV